MWRRNINIEYDFRNMRNAVSQINKSLNETGNER
jgi:hypothetical protein